MSTEVLDKINLNPLPFASTLQILFSAAEPDRVVAEMMIRKDLCTTGDVVHGGALMALADTVGGIATYINLPTGAKSTTTIESKTNFIGAGQSGKTLVATATPCTRADELRSGRRG
jgi:1,4-dihydroxy-2-naphthoyl-CoA hydrolase